MAGVNQWNVRDLPDNWKSVIATTKAAKGAARTKLIRRSRWRSYTFAQLRRERKVTNNAIIRHIEPYWHAFHVRRLYRIAQGLGKRISLFEAIAMADALGVPLEAIACASVNAGLVSAWKRAEKLGGGRVTPEYLIVEKILKPERHDDDDVELPG